MSLESVLSNRSAESLAIITPNVCLTYGELQTLNWQGVRDTNVIIFCKYEYNIVKAVVALDGNVSKLAILSPNLTDNDIAATLRQQKFDLVVTDTVVPETFSKFSISVTKIENALYASQEKSSKASELTRWLIPTSGTTSTPKLVTHTLSSLAKAAFSPTNLRDNNQVWGLFYDVSRFAGLQVLLNCLIRGHTLVLSSTCQYFSDRIKFAAEKGVTHISATPTLWRKFLMSNGSNKLVLEQITLGGEGADQAILRKLNQTFPNARITHIYAATEVGVCFSVSDLKVGFPLSYLRENHKGVNAKIMNNKLFIQREKYPKYYKDSVPEADEHGWIDTGDVVMVRGDRFFIVGRETGIINVGGEKVIPEAVRGVLLDLDFISEVIIYGKKNPISGQLVAADVVLKSEMNDHEVRKLIDIHSRQSLTSAQRPRIVRIVNEIKVNSTGKAVMN